MVTMRAALTSDDHRRIREATAAVEERTGSKIAVVITRQSGRYVAYTVAWATLTAFVGGMLLAFMQPSMHARFLVFLELWIFVAVLLLLEATPLRFAIVSRGVRYGNARNLAHREFAAHAMGEGASQKRILVFVSMGERYVEVIADHATHALAPQESWNRIVDELIAKVSSGLIADGVVSAIEACGDILPDKTPHQSANPSRKVDEAGSE
jgi:putative membrane protein